MTDLDNKSPDRCLAEIRKYDNEIYLRAEVAYEEKPDYVESTYQDTGRVDVVTQFATETCERVLFSVFILY